MHVVSWLLTGYSSWFCIAFVMMYLVSNSYLFMSAGLAKIIFATYSNLEQYLHPQSDAPNPVNDLSDKRGPVAPVAHRRYPTTERNYIQWQPHDRIVYNREDDEQEEVLEKEQKVVGTQIISASVGSRKAERVPLKEPVIYTLEHKTVNCSFCSSVNGKKYVNQLAARTTDTITECSKFCL